MESFKYILFPLPLIQEIFKKPKNGFSDIFDIGIYRVSQTLQINEYNALKQVLYCYYRGGLTKSLEKKFHQLEFDEVFFRDDDYNGFNDYEFVPDEAIESIYEYCKENPDFQKEIEEFHRLRQVKDVLEITFNISSIINTYKTYNIAYNGFNNQPLVSIKKDMMFDFYKNSKTDYEKALFAMYAGIRSIIGNKDFAETTGSMIKCRMFGAKNQDELEFILKDKKVTTAYKRYTTDYHYKKMLKELVARGFLMSEIGYNKRTFVSCKLDMKGLEDAIVNHIQNKSLNYKVKQVENNRLQALNSIKRRLNKESS
ncbi:hypothetical protein [Parabacteroides pacaensis]|uniref:hypothetical protein n=1 Tax=Parabacteroides pacaensis TaxID=2086575 RepID=UPI000D0F3BB6|nr:hypothetical protein [Parabacteroides pacaensis]